MIGLAEIGGGEQLQVETRPAQELRGQGTGEVHGHANGVAVGLDPDPIFDPLLFEAERDFGAIRGPVDEALAGDRKLSPLARRGFEAHIANGGDPLAVLDDLDAALLAFGIDIVEHQDRKPRLFEILLVVEDPARNGFDGLFLRCFSRGGGGSRQHRQGCLSSPEL